MNGLPMGRRDTVRDPTPATVSTLISGRTRYQSGHELGVSSGRPSHVPRGPNNQGKMFTPTCPCLSKKLVRFQWVGPLSSKGTLGWGLGRRRQEIRSQRDSSVSQPVPKVRPLKVGTYDVQGFRDGEKTLTVVDSSLFKGALLVNDMYNSKLRVFSGIFRVSTLESSNPPSPST